LGFRRSDRFWRWLARQIPANFFVLVSLGGIGLLLALVMGAKRFAQLGDEYYALWVLMGLGAAVWIAYANRRFIKEMNSEFREQQMLGRPEGCRTPEFPEWCLFAVVWGEYKEAANVAVDLRERYELDWEPEMGRRLARWLYTYEAMRALPRLHRITGRRTRRRYVVGS
jgi:hypothetical protein